MRTAVCLIVKDEEDCINEWLLHYHNIGFDEAIVYDNISSDKTALRVNACAAKLNCRVISWASAGGNAQLHAYNDCLKRFGKQFDWIAFFDIDEMLVSSTGDTDVKDTLYGLKDASAVGINWVMYGSNGQQDKGAKLVMEAFTARGPLGWGGNRNTKAIVRPAMINGLCNNPHWFPVEGRRVTLEDKPLVWDKHEDGSPYEGVVAFDSIYHGDWRLNHYYTRGERKWQARVARGQFGGLIVTDQHRLPLDRSDEQDLTALPYAAAVRRLSKELDLRL